MAKWVLKIVLDDETVHVSSHGARRYAEFEFRKVTKFTWRQFQRGESATRKYVGSTIEKVARKADVTGPQGIAHPEAHLEQRKRQLGLGG